MTTPTRIKRSELESLSQAELAALVQKAMELEQAQKQRTLDAYHETAHEDQIDFHKSPKRIRYLLGGNRSGKTTAGSVEAIWLLMGRHPYRQCKLPIKGAVVVQDFENHAKNILEPKIMQWAPLGTIVRVERNQNGAWRKVYFSSGSTLDVLSHDQDLKVFEGGDYDFVWFDEPPPKAIFNALWRGLTDRGGCAFITATPLTSPYLYKEIRKAEQGCELRWFRYVHTERNAKNIGEGDVELGKKRIAEFAALLDDDEKEARLSGMPVALQGLIFKGWNRATHLITPFVWPASWPIIESIDPHPHKPYGISWTGIAENGAKILLRSGYYQGVLEEIGNSIIYERAQIKISGNNKPRIIRCLIDNMASVPLWQKSQFNTDVVARRVSVREELENFIGPRSGGPIIEVAPKNVKGKIDIFKGWLRVNPELKRADFYIFNSPENESFMDEIEEYVWDYKRTGLNKALKDTPLKENDDILDSVLQVALTLKNTRHTPATAIKIGSASTWKV